MTMIPAVTPLLSIF